MARDWLFVQGGWEYGPIRLIRNANALQQKPFIEGADGNAFGAGGFAPEKIVVGTGYFSHREPGVGLMSLTDANGAHVFARTQNRIMWCADIGVTGIGADPTLSDDYLFSRCAKVLNSGPDGDNYLGIGVKITSLGPPVQYSFRILRFLSTGAFDVNLGSPSAGFDMDNTVHWAVLDHDVAAGTARLIVDGVAGASVATGVVQTTAHHLRDNRFIGGKGTDKAPKVVYDTFCTAQGDADADRPPTSMRQILYQPVCDVIGETEWTGDHRDVDDENDVDVTDTSTDANVIAPTGAGQKQIFAFDDLVSEPAQTATVEAVLLIWEQATTTFLGNNQAPKWDSHKPFARTTSSTLTDFSGDYGSGHQPDGDRLWFSRLLQVTPEGLTWTAALFNQFQAGLESKGTGNESCGELYAIPIGEFIDRPAATASGAPLCTENPPGAAPAAAVAPPVGAQVI